MRIYVQVIILIIICFLFLNSEGFAYRRTRYYGKEYRDPFKSVIPKSPRRDIQHSLNLKIEGIIWDTDKPSVIINGEVFNIGDSVAGAKIEGISKNGILVLFKGEKFLVNAGGAK